MNKIIYGLILLLLVVGGLVFANRELKDETASKAIPKPLTAAENEAALKEWQATPAGKMYKEWQMSPAGKKVYSSAAKLSKYFKDSSKMEAVVTSRSLPSGSRLGFGVMVNIDGDDYILAFGQVRSSKNTNNEFEKLHSLKVNDKILVRSRGTSHAPKYAYPIISADYLERDGEVIYKRVPRVGGC